jgi:hypothetical protein
VSLALAVEVYSCNVCGALQLRSLLYAGQEWRPTHQHTSIDKGTSAPQPVGTYVLLGTGTLKFS